MKKNINKKINNEQLIEQERLATIGQLMGGIIHNLSTPILGTSGQLMLCKRKTGKIYDTLSKYNILEEEFNGLKYISKYYQLLFV